MPCKTSNEYVLHIPPRLTKSAYQILIACNAVPRQWHLEGRFGSRTHNVDKSTNGIPVLYDQSKMNEEISLTSPELKILLDTEGVAVVEKEFIHNHRTRQTIPVIDARIHPELEQRNFVCPNITPKCMTTNKNKSHNHPAFTYAEMFGGIGGFGIALDALGGQCKFFSEISERCRETYEKNFDTPTNCIHGDIYEVPDADFPKNLDLLAAGFPCQPFSNLGEQPGLDCEKGRGQLFLQIVRMLEVSKPKCFLFENVPGLLGMNATLDVIVNAFKGAGYHVSGEVCSARGLTATCRKRLFFAGIRNDLANGAAKDTAKSESSSPFDSGFFEWPYIPDLKLCAHDILDYDTLPSAELELLRLSQTTWSQLQLNKKWKPSQLAWPNKQCDTLTSHYGNAVGRGDSQLVPSSAPHPPRRFSVRECARAMGFPNSYQFCDIRSEQGEMAHIKEGYRMVGNSVCIPLIAALASAVLGAAGIEKESESVDHNWIEKGRRIAGEIASASLRSSPVHLPAGCLISSSSTNI